MNTEQHANARVIRHFRAPPEHVFDAWLDAKTAGKWLFAAATGEVVCVEIDGRVGGWFYIVHRRDGEDVEHIGEYCEVERPSRLVFTLSVEKYTLNFDRVSIAIVPFANGCKLTLTHQTNPAADSNRIEVGWAHVLDRLATTIGARHSGDGGTAKFRTLQNI
jgi:uncharacterized protein YndB with AHSA1/START domain